MRQLLYNAMLSFVSGAAFVLGVGVVAAALSLYYERDRRPDLVFVPLPAGVEVLEHARVNDTPYFSVQGVVENTSEQDWAEVSLEMDILAGTALMNSCSGNVRRVPPSSRRAFLVECYRVAGTSLPHNVTYRIRIEGARKERDT